MGDTIEFPHNNRMYFEEAQTYFNQQEFERALDAIEKVYAKDKHPHVILLYTMILTVLEEFEEALEIANEQRNIFLTNEEYCLSYVRLLIENQSYIEAETIIQQQLEDPSTVFITQWEAMNIEFNRHRTESIKLQEEKNKETKRALMALENYSLFKQNEVVDQARNLSLEDLREVAQRIFSSPNITGMIQRAFLEILVEKQDSQLYTMNWFNQERKIVPIERTRFEQAPILQEIQYALNQKLQKHPEMKEIVYTEMIRDLLLLYPFMEEVVTDVGYFVDCYISYVDVNQLLNIQLTPTNEQQTDIYKWFVKLNEISGRSLNNEE